MSARRTISSNGAAVTRSKKTPAPRVEHAATITFGIASQPAGTSPGLLVVNVLHASEAEGGLQVCFCTIAGEKGPDNRELAPQPRTEFGRFGAQTAVRLNGQSLAYQSIPSHLTGASSTDGCLRSRYEAKSSM